MVGKPQAQHIFAQRDRKGTLQRNLDLSIPRKGIARRQSQFPNSCVCERSILYVPMFGPPIFLQKNRVTDQRNI
jgi:hypothetical protein